MSTFICNIYYNMFNRCMVWTPESCQIRRWHRDFNAWPVRSKAQVQLVLTLKITDIQVNSKRQPLSTVVVLFSTTPIWANIPLTAELIIYFLSHYCKKKEVLKLYKYNNTKNGYIYTLFLASTLLDLSFDDQI